MSCWAHLVFKDLTITLYSISNEDEFCVDGKAHGMIVLSTAVEHISLWKAITAFFFFFFFLYKFFQKSVPQSCTTMPQFVLKGIHMWKESDLVFLIELMLQLFLMGPISGTCLLNGWRILRIIWGLLERVCRTHYVISAVICFTRFNKMCHSWACVHLSDEYFDFHSLGLIKFIHSAFITINTCNIFKVRQVH